MGWERAQIGVTVTVYLAVYIVMLDVSIVVLALPSIQADLAASPSAVQWVIAAYTLCLSVLSISGGSLGDRYGRKRVFHLGLAVFTVGSGLCAAAAGPEWLILARVVQGTGAALLVPGGLSLLALAFPDSGRRAKAIAGWSTVAGAGALSGPVIGGLLIDTFGWPSIFLLNLPLGALALVVGRRSVRESADREHADLDVAGQMLGIGWLGGLAYGLSNVGAHGWDAPATLGALGFAVILMPVFIVVELRQPRPMLPVRMFRASSFALPILVNLAVGFSLLSMGVFLAAYLQQAQHHSATVAGLIMLPSSAVAVLAPFATGRWLARSGPRVPMITGMLVVAAGLFTLLAVEADSGALLTITAMCVTNIGYGLAAPATTAAALAGADRTRSGTASAVVSAVRQTGITLGIAVLGSILAVHLDDPGVRTPETAHTDGLHSIALVGACVLLAVTGLLLRNPARRATGSTGTASTRGHPARTRR